jgi:hypothetical protein
MNEQVIITSAKLAEECECLGVFVQLLVENLAPTLALGGNWMMAVERTLADYGCKVVDAETGQDLTRRGDAP